MAGSTKQPYFCHGDWPLTDNSQITGDHFEDLRKLCFIVMNPETGHVKGTWVGYGVETESILPTVIEAKDHKVGELIIKTSRTKLWATEEAVSLGCWRSISLTGDTYEALTDLSEAQNTTSPDASANWRKITNPPALVYTNSLSREWEGGVPTGANFPMPDVHPSAGVWMSNSSSNTSNGWVILRDFNKYHDWDFNALCRYAGNRDYGTDVFGGSINYTCNIAAHEFLPLQVDSNERNKPWVYQGDKDEDFLSREYRFQPLPDKQYWRKEGVTVSESLTAVFGTTALLNFLEDESEQEPAKNQYWVDGVWPGSIHSGRQWYSPKICDSLQTMIEHLASDKNLCWPVDSTYISNWEAVNDDTWSLGKRKCHPYPSVQDEYWGCNGSGFELLLRELGTDYYDWVFDTENPYIPYSIQKELYDSLTPLVSLYTQKGTWRRTWKYTMGRAKSAYMRSSEMGAPTSTNSYALWDGEHYDTIESRHWSGIYTTTEPAVTAYETSSVLNFTTKTEYSFTTDGEEAGLKVGMMVRVSESGEDDLMTWIVSVNTEGDYTTAAVAHSLANYTAEGMTVRYNTNITNRHDPIKIEFNPGSVTPYPKYKLDHRMLQHCYDILHYCKYTRHSIYGIVGKSTFANADYQEHFLSESFSTMQAAFSHAKGLIANFWSTYDDPSEWSGGNGKIGWKYYGVLERSFGYYDEEWNWIDEERIYPIDAYVVESRLALKLQSQGEGYELEDETDNLFFKNKHPIICVSYQDLNCVDPDYQFNGNAIQGYADHIPLYGMSDSSGTYGTYSGGVEWHKAVTVAGIDFELHDTPQESPPTQYALLQLSSLSLDDWTVITAPDTGYSTGNIFGYISSWPTPPSAGDNWQRCYKGYGVVGFSIKAKDVVGELDFNLVPSSVFIDAGGRDRIGAEEPEGTPAADTDPPKPDPAQINIMPALEWSRILIEEEETDTEHPTAGYYWRLNMTVTAVLAEDLAGSTPVQYKAIIVPAASETVPEDGYGTSAKCTVKLFDDLPEDEAIGENYTYTGTPIKLDADGDVISSGDTTTPVVSWRYNVSHGGALHEGDSVYFPSGVSGSEDDGEEYEIINIDSSSSFDIAKTTQPTSVTDLSIWDVSGYNLADWQEETAYGWTVKVTTKDDENNETNPSQAEAIEVAADWPLDLYLAEIFQDRAGYLETLE